jgi:cell division septum initiation protein DivIVA
MATKKELENQIAELRAENAGLRIRAEKSGNHLSDIKRLTKELAEAKADAESIRSKCKPPSPNQELIKLRSKVEKLRAQSHQVGLLKNELSKSSKMLSEAKAEVEALNRLIKSKPTCEIVEKVVEKTVKVEVPVDRVVERTVYIETPVEKIVYRPKSEDVAEIARLKAELDKINREGQAQ